MTGNICIICAWRETCKKKFSISGKDMQCADFVKDLAIEKKAQEQEAEAKAAEAKKEG